MTFRMPSLGIRLWVKLAIFAAVGVVISQALHLAISTGLVANALAREQEGLGRGIARLLAREAAEAVLVEDAISLHELMTGAVSENGVAYCLVVRGGSVLASSFRNPPPRLLLDARRGRDQAPLVVLSGRTRYLDLVEPILDGSAGEVRIGLDMSIVESTRRRVAAYLSVLALAIMAVGVVAAFILGRSIARPIGDLLTATDRFDPGGEARLVEPRGTEELRELTERFNRMMVRLGSAHAQQRLARSKEGETERMAALGSLVSGVAHEVNNPLAGIKNCLRRLQREEASGSPRSAEYLELMEEGLERIEDVMRGLLDLARPRPLELGEVWVNDVVREGTSLLRPTLDRRRIALVQADGHGRVIADRKQAGQALLNLLLNAAYVTTDGGEIRLRLRERPGLCGIAVEDDGPGIPPEIRDRVLDPFFSTKPDGEGTGLGLSVTKSILDAHGGELTLECPGRGTCWTMWLRSIS
ncbi:MAG: HAMP domain-containing histidine kinase [Deltaproteobacteria bacterium]|nr:HAMP domain-containing histidine kinase [Deltaproteobacteria bacterium]